jgi:hypothetical protein
VLLGYRNSCLQFLVNQVCRNSCRVVAIFFLVLLGCCNSCDFSALSIFFFFFFFFFFVWVVIMSGENSIVHFNGKNYANWEFQFRMFVKGKEL